MTFLRRGVLLTGVLLFTVPGVGTGQTNQEVNAGLQFNFSLPGARSLAMGGAFLGLADDATAAYANPAGLMNLSRPEVSIEGRQWSYSTPFVAGGRFQSEATGFGVDTVSGLQIGESDDDTTGISFLSYVYPQEKWSFAIYRHELANFENSFTTSGAIVDHLGFENIPAPGLLITTPNSQFRIPGGNSIAGALRLFPVQAAYDLEIVNYGVSFAFQMAEDFSLGVGLSYFDFELQSSTNRFGLPQPVFADPQDPFATADLDSFFPPATFSMASLLTTERQSGSDNDVTPSLGFLWKLGQRFRLGGAYRIGPEFSVQATASGAQSYSTNTTFHVPDVLGFGIAFLPTESMRFSLDWNRVEYGDLLEDFNAFTDGTFSEADYAIEDGDEFRAGFEKTFTKSRFPLSVRLGTFYDPAHRIQFEGEVPPADEFRFRWDSTATTQQNFSRLISYFNSQPPIGSSLQELLWQPGDDEWHYSAGVGIAFDRFQLDAAYDYSDTVSTASLSAVFFFGGP